MFILVINSFFPSGTLNYIITLPLVLIIFHKYFAFCLFSPCFSMLTILLGAAFGNFVPAVTELNFLFGHKTIPKSLCSASVCSPVAGQIWHHAE